MLNQVDAGRGAWRELKARRRNPLVLFALVLVVGTPSTGLRAEDEPASPPAHAPASAAYARGTIWVLDLAPGDAAAWLGSRQPTEARPVRRLKPAGARWLLAAVRRSDDASLLGTHRTPDVGEPRLSVERLDTFSYVQDFDVEKAGEATVANPLVGTLQHGTTGVLEVRADSDDAPRWHLKLAQAQVQLPVPTFKTELTVGEQNQQVTIQLPEIRVKAVTRDLPEGAGWYLAGMGLNHRARAEDSPRRRMLLVRVAELPAELPPGAAPLRGKANVLLEARVVDHPQAALPEGYKGGLTALDAASAAAWWKLTAEGVLNLPSIVTLVGEEALVEIIDPSGGATRLQLTVALWSPSRITPISELSLEVTGSYSDPEVSSRTWKRALSSKNTLVVPLTLVAPLSPGASPDTTKAKKGRYLLLRATLLNPGVEK